MRVLVAPQEFKGTLTSDEAARAIAAGLTRAAPRVSVDTLPMADGGPGTLDALTAATGGDVFDETVLDPLGRPRRARWGGLGGAGRTAVVEMAEASGLVLLARPERDPRRASTFGTGQLLVAALDAGYRRIIVGVGGSATNDGGAGAAQALGARLLTATGQDLPPGAAPLAQIASIDASTLHARLEETEVVVAADVTNPLCGPDGASFVYGPQKGADPEVVRELDAALVHFASVVKRDLGVDLADTPGAGAAGGLAYSLMVFCGATIRPGFDVVAEAVDFDLRIKRSGLVITGEGRLDRQSEFGKTTARVARAARSRGKPVIAIVGSVQGEHDLFDLVFSLQGDGSVQSGSDDAAARLEQTAERACRELLRRGLLR